jgi:cytochrome c peroxidase
MSRKQLPTHDGRFGTLEAVLNHYSNGVKDSPTLDPILKRTVSIPLSDSEKLQLISF